MYTLADDFMRPGIVTVSYNDGLIYDVFLSNKMT